MSEREYENAVEKLKASFKIAMLENGYTQRQLSKMIGVNEAQISRAINGDMQAKSKMIRNTLRRILGMNGGN